MFSFGSKKNKNKAEEQFSFYEEETPKTSGYDSNEKNPIIFLTSVIDNNVKMQAFMIDASAMKNPKSAIILSKASEEFLLDFARRVNGRVFELVNRSVLIFFDEKNRDELSALLIRLQFLLNEEMLLSGKSQLLDTDFAHIYATPEELAVLLDKIKNYSPIVQTSEKENVKEGLFSKFATVSSFSKKKYRDLTPLMLDKLQKSLLQVDFSSLIRRQAVCAIIGKSAPQMIFEEVFVSIPDLRDIAMPDVNFTSNPWLFTCLTETLDKRVLAHASQHDDGSLVSNFSLNLNVSTILSDEFLEFDETIPPSLRSSIVLELQLVDIFNDVKAYLLAKAFAQYRGYKICIDGISVDKLQYINRENLNSDLMKIIWHPSFLDVINNDKHFRDYVNKAERARMILCRVDDPKAIEIGNSLGINLYQGRYVQKELNKSRK